jgi:hypothetical protein
MAVDNVTPEVKAELGALDAREAGARDALARLASEGVQREQARQAAIAPAQAAYDATAALPGPKREPEVPPPVLDQSKLKIDPKEYEGLSYALIGMALIGGATSHGNWLGASSALNGALKGFQEGNKEVAQREYDRFKRETESAAAHERAADKRYEDALKDRNLTLNQQLARVKTIAAEFDHKDVLAAAQSKSFEAVINQVESRRAQLLGTLGRMQTVTVQIDARQQAAKDRAAAGGSKNAPKTAAGNDLASMLLERSFPVSFFGGKGELFDSIAAREAAKGRTLEQIADDMVSGKIALAADTGVAKTTAVRQAAVKRLTETVKGLESRVMELAKANGNGQNPDLNLAMNAFAKRFGSDKGQADLSELQTLMGSVGRLYQEAVTMPGSNAQMHATAQEWADGHFNPNMSLAQIVGAIRGMNLEISKTEQSLGRSKAEAERKPAGGHPADIRNFLSKYGGSR